jgi:predicted homoserine dehydrogenase-like protein
MIIVDTALRKRAEEGRPVRVAMIGAGAIGRGVASQIVNRTQGMVLAVVANRTVANAERALELSGISEWKVVTTAAGIDECVAKGIPAVTDDLFLACDSAGIDIIVEVLSDVELAAEVALHAFSRGKDYLTMNAEMDATFGLELRARADEAGVIYSVSDGDQPGVEMNLWRYVKGLGMEPLVCGNIKGLQDCRRNPTTQEGFAKTWNQGVKMVTSFADGTKISFEQACVANATGMCVSQRGMLGGDFKGHIDELCHSGRYDVDELRRLGGVVDYVVGSSPAAGVFVLATHDDPFHQFNLKLYKMGDGPLYAFYAHTHLCYFDVPISAARMVLFRDTVIAAREHKVDVVTVAKTDLKAGTVLDGIGGYHSYGVCENAPAAVADRLLPMGLSEGCRLLRDIPCDAVIGYDDVEVPAGRLIDELRNAMLQRVAGQP